MSSYNNLGNVKHKEVQIHYFVTNVIVLDIHVDDVTKLLHSISSLIATKWRDIHLERDYDLLGDALHSVPLGAQSDDYISN